MVAIALYCPAGAVVSTVMFAVIEVGELTTIGALNSTWVDVAVVGKSKLRGSLHPRCVLMPLICTAGRVGSLVADRRRDTVDDRRSGADVDSVVQTQRLRAPVLTARL